MAPLKNERCEVCRTGAPPTTPAEIEEYRRDIPEWRIVTVDGIDRLTRTFTFGNFRQALAFTDRVGDLAEEEQHHPSILTEWGKVRVQWWTHKIGGLHRNDFIMAAKTDALQP